MISHHDVYEGVYQSNAEGKLKQLETEAKAKKERVKELEDSKYGIRACINVAASQTGLIDKMTQRGLVGHVADQEIWDGRVEDPPADQKKTDATTAEEPLDIDQFDSKLVCNSVVDVSGAATTNRAQE
ncbi:hypothetical protein F2Q69_00015551 [Brassica cretica]|uniref:Uncharacterized protein n=1 Tax=Brassica cretica TaxID=69181 RepID=A0A8S9R348_BRACR|nr:hypothetical protein F2Q69_00015551 [Brassica cretica]